MAEHDFRLTTAALDIVWHDRELGTMPYPVDLQSHGRTMAERAALRDAVHADLTADGLLQRGRLEPDLEDLLSVLSKPHLVLDVVGYTDRPLRAVAATDGMSAALVVLDGDVAGISAIRTTGLASAVVGLLPSRPAGDGHAMTVPLAAFSQAIDRDEPFADPDRDERSALVHAGVARRESRELVDLAASRVAGGQFGVSRSEPYRSDRYRCGSVVSWFDTDRGRYLAVPDGTWLSIAPTDSARLAARIDTLLAAAQA
ncbi:ESX secretion-associated protein EspG [Longimycelium tulufanense]|uniref:ESX secretion-associated protein EspG n=1 Tax=Longimycelium tulufanense TaxID=907463 RepID=A0A8J3FUK9_9PSEU|nr:ESX secretion-associated protein EspG [Longimycelium tulufanense]GGM51261.1 ESX secretion-associated protein EspG [Longimycelium tulufanense]